MPTDERLELAPSKLRRPELRPGMVRRSALVERLARDDVRPVVSVVAPAGYGKTTLLSQWAESDDRPFAWVSVDDRDDDAKVLLAYVAEALDRVEPVGRSVFEALASSASSVHGSVVPRLGAALATRRTPVVLVLDDVHLLHNWESRSALSTLAEQMPAGSQIVLAGREAPPVRVARLRAEGRISEVGPTDLSMSSGEAAALLRAAEVALDDDDIATLHQRTEGWPVGLYLAALFLREGGAFASAAVSFSGDDRLVTEYMESEFLTRIPAHDRMFLTRSAALERMSGALCESALDLPGAAATLVDLAKSNMLLVPMDRRGQWFRYHHLFGGMLRGELERRDPGTALAVRRRAAAWCLANDQPEEALEYSLAAQDTETAAQLIEQLWLPVYWRGQHETLKRWIGWLERRDAIKAHPMIAAMASFHYSVTGQPVEAEKWADLLDRWQYGEPGWAGDRATEAFTATLRAVHCRNGVEQVRADVEEAALKYAAEGILSPTPACYSGLACMMAGEADRADAFFRQAATTAEEVDAQEMLVVAFYERSLLAMARGDWATAEALSDQAAAAARHPGTEEVGLWVLKARLAAHRADRSVALDALAHAQRLRPLLTYALPIYAVQLRIELARTYLALADYGGARTMMVEIDDLLQRRPKLGTLVDQAAELRSLLSRDFGQGTVGQSALTSAELRLVPLLNTHLTVKEIATELFLSRNTVSSQLQSIYRKLGVNSRNQAVIRARELHLLD